MLEATYTSFPRTLPSQEWSSAMQVNLPNVVGFHEQDFHDFES